MKQQLHFLKRLSVLFVFFGLMVLPGVGWGQTWTYDFGDGTGTYTSSTASTSFLPAPSSNGGTARVRVGTNPGSITMANPGLASLGTNTELQITSNTGSTSTTKFSIYDYTAGKTGYVKFKIAFSGGTDGVYNFTLGDGATFSDNTAMSNSQIFAGVRWSFGASNGIVYNVLNNTTWGTTGISDPNSLFIQNTSNVYLVEVYINNTTTTTNYTRSSTSYSLANATWDLWVDGVRVGTGLSKGALGTDVNIDSYAFNHQISATSPGTIYLDDLEYSNTLPTATPIIVLSDNGTQVGSGNINQGAINSVLSQTQAEVTVANATLNSFSFNTTGSYAATDIVNFKLRYSTDATLDDGDATLSTITSIPATGNTVTFSGLTQVINSATIGYFFVTADIAVNATPLNTIAVGQPTYTFASGTPTNNTTAGGLQTIQSVTPSIALADNGTQITAGNLAQSSTNHVLSSFEIAVSIANAELNGLDITTAGSYIASDVSNLKLWYSTNNTFDIGTDVLLQTIAAPGVAGLKNFTGFNQLLSYNNTGYFFITIDAPCEATAGNTIAISTIDNADLSFTATVTRSGTASLSGNQTITAAAPNNITGLSAGIGNAQLTISWINPSGCYDEIMIVAKPTSTIGASPSGDGSAYTANLAFGSGTTFDGTGYVVYKGSTSPQTITGLANGTTYYVKVFTRKGSDWSGGVESNATPTLVDATVRNYTGNSGGAWLTTGNWTSSTIPTSSEVAAFAGTQTSVGINMNNPTNNGANHQIVGAIEVESAKTGDISIGNSTTAIDGTLTLGGVRVNSIENMVLRNNDDNNLTIQNTAGSGNKLMDVILGNSTNNRINIDGSGNIIISSVITSASSSVTIGGNGSGIVEFSGQNTYTANTMIEGTTLRLNRTGGTTIPATNNITVNGGTLRISSNQTLNNLAIEAGSNLVVDGGITLSIDGTLSINESITIAGNLAISASGITEIAAGKALTISGTLTNNATEGIILASPESHSPAGSLIIEGAYSGSGTLKAERHILSYSTSANGWHLLSSPVNNPIIATETNLAPGAPDDFYGYDEITYEWLNYKVPGNGLTSMNNGKGFLVAYQSGSTKHMIGTPNTSSLVIAGGETNLSKTDGKGNGWHLLGNPFQSAIIWNVPSFNWNLSNISTTAKLMTNTGGFDDLDNGDIIPAMQGFWVQAVDASNTITIPTDARVHNSTPWLKSETNDKIVLISHDVETGMLQKSRIRFNADATPDYDLLFDSRFMAWYAPSFYSIAGVENLSTNTLPELTDELVIPFGFKKNGSSNFSIELSETIEGKTIYLTDLKTNTIQKLSENPIYAFTSAEGDDPNRFLLHFGLVSVDEQLPTETLQAYAYNNRLYVNSSLEKASLSLYDLQGRLLLQRQICESGLQSVEMKMPAGVYIVRLQNTQQSKSVKIVVQ